MFGSAGTGAPLAQVPRPISDTTQDATLSAEYAGDSFWGQKWNAMVSYNASVYTDEYAAFIAQNPFGGPPNPGQTCYNTTPGTTAANDCFAFGQMSNPPSNWAGRVLASDGCRSAAEQPLHGHVRLQHDEAGCRLHPDDHQWGSDSVYRNQCEPRFAKDTVRRRPGGSADKPPWRHQYDVVQQCADDPAQPGLEKQGELSVLLARQQHAAADAGRLGRQRQPTDRTKRRGLQHGEWHGAGWLQPAHHDVFLLCQAEFRR